MAGSGAGAGLRVAEAELRSMSQSHRSQQFELDSRHRDEERKGGGWHAAHLGGLVSGVIEGRIKC